MKADNRKRDRTKNPDHADPYFSCVLVHLLRPMLTRKRTIPYIGYRTLDVATSYRRRSSQLKSGDTAYIVLANALPLDTQELWEKFHRDLLAAVLFAIPFESIRANSISILVRAASPGARERARDNASRALGLSLSVRYVTARLN